MTAWIIVANASEASIYEADYFKASDYQLLETFQHPESRAKGETLLADIPGRTEGDTYEHIEPKVVEAERFACQLAHHVKHAVDRNKFNELLLVMPAHFHGFFMRHFTSKFSNIQYISKDYTKLSADELTKFIHEQLSI